MKDLPYKLTADEFVQLVNINLTQILSGPNESRKSSEFIDLSLKKLSNPNELIEFMVREDLIETETNPEVYFLTEYGYTCLETDGWDMWDDDQQVDLIKIKNESNVELMPATRTPRKYSMTLRIYAVLFMLGAIVAIGRYNNWSIFNNQKMPPVDFQKLYKVLDSTKSTVTKKDSLKKNYPFTPIHHTIPR